jgi:hypothetical protein
LHLPSSFEPPNWLSEMELCWENVIIKFIINIIRGRHSINVCVCVCKIYMKLCGLKKKS